MEAMMNGPQDQFPVGVEVSHADLLASLQEMHNAQYQQDFSTIVQLRAGLKKAQQNIAALNNDCAGLVIQLDEAKAEIVAGRAAFNAANARIEELEDAVTMPTDDNVDRP